MALSDRVASATQNALTSLSNADAAPIANSPKALTSLSNADAAPIANSPKALTSLAVAARDILARSSLG